MKEARFDLHEMFFSITDKNSTILSSNETFVRISEYNKDEITGQFHNIVRHPDMPRVVFKRFWDYIKADKPIIAYVKNKTKNGAYYWVLAAVFPQKDKYISIRIKPNSPMFEIAKDLYSKLLIFEEKLQMHESEQQLNTLLNNLGFKSYDQYMNEVLLVELLERKKLFLKENIVENSSNANTLYEISKSLVYEYLQWFEKIDSYQKIKIALEEKGLVLRTLARDIIFLSLNASVASYKLEENGEVFGVLASDIRQNAKENEHYIKSLDNVAQNLSDSMSEVIFLVSYTSLQMEMVTYFLKEILGNKDAQISYCVKDLYLLVIEYNEKLMKLPLLIEKTIKKSILYLDELEEQFIYLGYVQIYGIIEAQRNIDDKLGFNEIFSQLKSLVAKTSEEIILTKNITEKLSIENSKLINDSQKIENLLTLFENEMLNIKTTQG